MIKTIFFRPMETQQIQVLQAPLVLYYSTLMKKKKEKKEKKRKKKIFFQIYYADVKLRKKQTNDKSCTSNRLLPLFNMKRLRQNLNYLSACKKKFNNQFLHNRWTV